MSNCGVDKDRVDACIASILQDNFPNAGIDVMDGEVKDMVKAKIIDPKKVLKHALLNAASVASILMTTATTITRIPEKE